MAELKTKKNDGSIEGFLNNVEPEKKRADSVKILELMRKVTGLEPKMWGDSMIGLGKYHYRYATGHESDAGLVGFSPRKQNLTLYLMGCYVHPDDKQYDELFSKLGKFKQGKSCLYIHKLEDVDMNVLEKLVRKSYHDMKNFSF
ncbi:MAG: hypothetical protein CVU41_17555 [Chloroflexi bacterium HGW-Chloroflexi-3]|nr:MAG: hypothetical protein CVU41_17555 [Chloroflexi bacterium HGW-Chloroflexi-3]